MSSDANNDANETQFEGVRVGVITHFFDHISVAVVEAEDTIKVGDSIKIYDKDGNVVVEQTVDSMQVDKADIQEAKKGDEFGMKVDGAVKDGYLVYKQ